jgi:hypothetical protein
MRCAASTSGDDALAELNVLVGCLDDNLAAESTRLTNRIIVAALDEQTVVVPGTAAAGPSCPAWPIRCATS